MYIPNEIETRFQKKYFEEPREESKSKFYHFTKAGLAYTKRDNWKRPFVWSEILNSDMSMRDFEYYVCRYSIYEK